MIDSPSGGAPERLQDGISRVQKVAAVEIGFRGAPGCFWGTWVRSRRFHPVWTPFDIPFLRNTEIGKKTAIRAGPSVSRLVPKMI